MGAPFFFGGGGSNDFHLDPDWVLLILSKIHLVRWFLSSRLWLPTLLGYISSVMYDVPVRMFSPGWCEFLNLAYMKIS